MKYKEEYYISPDGKVIKLKDNPKNWISIHDGIAQEVTGITNGKATDILHNLGWIAMGGISGWRIKHFPTQAQINTLNRLGLNHIVDHLINN